MDPTQSGMPKSSLKRKAWVAGFQNKNPKKVGPTKEGKEDMMAQKVATDEPKEALLDLTEKARMGNSPQIQPVTLASEPEMAAMATHLSVARKSQSSPGPIVTAMATRLAVVRKSLSSSDLVTTAMASPLAVTGESQSPSGSVTPAMATRLASERKTLSTSSLVTLASDTSLAVARKRQPLSGTVTTTIAPRLAVSKKGHSLFSLVTETKATRSAVAKKTQSSSGPATTTMVRPMAITTSQSAPPVTTIATQSAIARKGQSPSSLGTKAKATHSAVARKSKSSSPVTTAIAMAITTKSQSSQPGTSATATPSAIARKVQSPVTGPVPQTGTPTIQKSLTEETAKKVKITDKKRQPSEKQQRFSKRLTESSFRFKDIVVRKQDGFTHIFLSTKSSEYNSLNQEVMKEIQGALNKAAVDDSKLVLLSSVNSVFCGGLDFAYFIQRLIDDRKRESTKMADSVKNFVNTFIQFKKPIFAAVNGPAVGLGASILPLCDVVWANEKAWFQTPYTTFGQSPDGCSSFTFPKIMGAASANEMLLSGRRLTAREACDKGLVSQVFWPDTFSQEVMIRIKELTSCNAIVLEESKALLRYSMKIELEEANERECKVLKNIWGSTEGMDSMLKYLQKKIEF